MCNCRFKALSLLKLCLTKFVIKDTGRKDRYNTGKITDRNETVKFSKKEEMNIASS